ncbi:type II toxin-antitoxin system VapC family toxin [Leucobacter insecticola]|uniref:Type II toxin-antitoxin system VapC family toxin n=1 Tax=Leucobacter insecticola TaxID=2714934 RepID=A0A6G8FKJ9_9MICO|nr:type II toxin-antitoxin system VapC family toxin [Leucobacter insecticola]QIM16881.1 type II toxin-antitoxin system VapC family toxin [Leucobacter insecticola]
MTILNESLTGIDTNVLLRYLLKDDAKQYAVAKEFFASLSPSNPGFITQVTLAETYWVLAKSQKLPKATCLAIIGQLARSPVIEFDDGEGVMRAIILAEEGADFADALIEGAMGLFGVTETVTFDQHAASALGWRNLND